MDDIRRLSPHGPAGIAPAQPAPSPGRSRVPAWRWVVLGIGVLATAALLFTVLVPRSEEEPPLVVVAGYEPVALGTAYPALGNILADWVAFSLGGTGQVQVVDAGTRIHALLGLPDDGTGDRTHRMRTLAREAGARWLLTGAYFRVGDSLAVVTRVGRPDSDMVIHSFRTAAHVSEDPSVLVDRVFRQASEWLLQSAGPGRAPLPPRDNQPPAYDAYATYLRGAQLWLDGPRHVADPHLRSALAADPRLAGPMAWLIGAFDPTWPWQWRDSLAQSLASEAAILPRSERALLGWWRARRGKDPAQALEAARAWVRAAPMSSEAKWWAARVAVEMGQAQVAADLLAQLRPGLDRLSDAVFRGAVSESGSWAFHEVGDYPAELAWLDLFRSEPVIGVTACRRAVAVRALMEPALDFEAAASPCVSEVPASNSLLTARLRLAAATELRAHGAIGPATQLANEAILQYEDALGNELPPRQAATYWGHLGELRMLTGDWTKSRDAFRQAIALEEHSSMAWGGLGVALALSGEVEESERVLDRLGLKADEVSAYEQARIHAVLGRTAEAAAILEQLSPRPFRAARPRYDLAFDGVRNARGSPR